MSTEAPRERSKLIESLQERRERHRQRGRIYRALVTLVGFTVLAAGIAMLVLPGPALAVIPVGLALLALEFTWAEEMLERAIEQAERAKQTATEASRAQKIFTVVAGVLAFAAFATWGVVSDIPLLPF